MLAQKFFLHILLGAATFSLTFCSNSGRIELSAVYKRRYEGPKELEPQYSPISWDTLPPLDEGQSQTSYGFDSTGGFNSAPIRGGQYEHQATFTTGTDSETEGTLDGGAYYRDREKNPPNWDEGGTQTLAPSENRANQQPIQAMGGTSDKNIYYTAEDPFGQGGSMVREGSLTTERSTEPHHNSWPLHNGKGGSSGAPLAGIVIVKGGSSTVQEVTDGGTAYTIDNRPVQPFNQRDGRRESSGWGAPADQQISTEGGMLDGSLAIESNRGSAYTTDTQPAQTFDKSDGGSRSSGWGATTNQRISPEGNGLDKSSESKRGPAYTIDTRPVQPSNQWDGRSDSSSLGGPTDQQISKDQGMLDGSSAAGNTRIIETSHAADSLPLQGEIQPVEAQPYYSGSSSTGGTQSLEATSDGKPLVEKTDGGGTQTESVHPVKGVNSQGLDKSPDKSIQNKGGKEKKEENKGTPDKKGEGPHKEAQEGEAVMHLESSRDTEYYGRISLGTAEDGQEQWFTVVIDTGSADLWVPKCGTCVPEPLKDCSNFRGFDGTKSSTFKPTEKPFILTYGDGTMIKGKIATDVMKLGSGKTQIVVPEMIFGLGETRQNSHARADGILGLGFKYGSGFPGKKTTPFQAMVDQAKIQPQFGIFLNRKASGEEIGELVLGGHDEDLIEEEFTFVDVKTTQYAYRYWIFKLDGISVGDKEINYDTNIRGLADSGCTLIIAPASVTEQINTAVWGSDKANWKQFFDCNSVNLDQLPKITFKIKDKPFVLTPQEYIGKIPPEHPWNEEEKSFFHTEERCVYGIHDMNIPNEIILGQVFMRVYYTKFDWEKKQIGFARAKHS